MESVENKILASIKKCGRGTVFFADRFARLASAERLHKAMELLIKRGEIIRVARGIFCYPRIEKVYGLGLVPPSVDEIASAIAKRDRTRIAPTALHAQNLLGMSQQVVMNYLYLTDGTARIVKLTNGSEIKFKHTAPKNLAFTNRLAMLITFALKDYGPEGVTEFHVNRIKTLLTNEKQEDIERDYHLMPDWIREIIRECYE
ncbi:MAG: DUF6088 family protein [Paludibacteraceae bacterium]|nr:DUF6088 family protein [Paludibacteraceae bacterium]